LSFVIFDQETGANSFSSISIDVDKPSDDSIGNNNQDNVVPPSESDDSQVCEDMAQQVAESSQEDGSSKSVVLKGVVSSDKQI
jgi:hypothetical protein